MAIHVQCKCGKGFSAKDALKGKKVKCPGCGEPLTVGATSTASGVATIAATCGCGKTVAAPAHLAGKAVKCPGCGKPLRVPVGSQDGDDMADLLDEVGFDKEKTKDCCPGCGQKLKENAVLCVHCGLNLETGKKLRTKSYTELAAKRINRTKLK